MTTATQKIDSPPTQTSTPWRSWNVPCPSCGEVGGLRIDPNNLGDDGTFNCSECETEFTFGQVRELLEAWPKFLAWIDLAPAAQGGSEPCDCASLSTLAPSWPM